MPPPFYPFHGLPARAKTVLGDWRRPILGGSMAIAAGLVLAAWTGQRRATPGPTLMPVAPAAQPIWQQWFRPLRTRSLLAVPPPVVPQPLPPQQAWPDRPRVAAQAGFSDVNPDHWAWPVLADLAQRQLITGFPDGTFRPASPMTRAEFATQLAQMFDLPLSRPWPDSPPYQDLAADHWAKASIQKSVQMGFLAGQSGSTFGPNGVMTKIDVVVALATGLGLKSSSSATVVLAPYRDRDQVPDWAIVQLIAATEAGLVVSYPDSAQLRPQQPVSRAEVAAMLHRALVYVGTLQAVPLEG